MYFVDGHDLSRRQTLYLNMLSEYDFNMVYRPGSENFKADALISIAD